ncbi:hypothetical protein Lal_00002360 [Lupinus albus]|nr:hypothetical protein Lal_00002360 [Lupinus albus]
MGDAAVTGGVVGDGAVPTPVEVRIKLNNIVESNDVRPRSTDRPNGRISILVSIERKSKASQ